MKIKLKEVLWEITNQCNRSCSYCGSRDIINCGEDTPLVKKLEIADEIGKNAESVTISGGEPFNMNPDDLSGCVTILRGHGCNVAVVTNGDKLYNSHFGIFDRVGVSLNTPEDCKTISSIFTHRINSEHYSSIVFIVNINKINFFDVDSIIQTAKNFNIPIQFQLTMYKTKDDAMINGEHIATTRDKLTKFCKAESVSFVFADNLQESHECSAGIRTCGVLFNGDVVPCLSERSWKLAPRVQGNLLIHNMSVVWKDAFKGCRFEDDYKCCRDCFNYTEPKPEPVLKEEEAVKERDVLKGWKEMNVSESTQEIGRDMMLYGVVDIYPPYSTKPNLNQGETITMLYGVFDIKGSVS